MSRPLHEEHRRYIARCMREADYAAKTLDDALVRAFEAKSLTMREMAEILGVSPATVHRRIHTRKSKGEVTW